MAAAMAQGQRRSLQWHAVIGLLLLLCAAKSCHGAAASSKGARITLNAKWNSTSALLEAAEFLVRAILRISPVMSTLQPPSLAALSSGEGSVAAFDIREGCRLCNRCLRTFCDEG